jgi:choline-glycine betaine transporter
VKAEIMFAIAATLMLFLLVWSLFRQLKKGIQADIRKNDLLEAEKQRVESTKRQDEILEIYNKRIAATPDDWDAVDKLRAEGRKI